MIKQQILCDNCNKKATDESIKTWIEIRGMKVIRKGKWNKRIPYNVENGLECRYLTNFCSSKCMHDFFEKAISIIESRLDVKHNGE